MVPENPILTIKNIPPTQRLLSLTLTILFNSQKAREETGRKSRAVVLDKKMG